MTRPDGSLDRQALDRWLTTPPDADEDDDHNEDEPDAGGTGDLILYVMALEELVRWLAIPYSYEDPNTGVVVQQTPIWQRLNQYGQPLPANDRLARTWARVFDTEEEGGPTQPTLNV